MSKSRANAARAAKAAAINRFSVEVARLRSSWRWTGRDVRGPMPGSIDAFLAKADQLAFELAQDVASGRVELDLPDEPRPLFDRATPPAAGPADLLRTGRLVTVEPWRRVPGPDPDPASPPADSPPPSEEPTADGAGQLHDRPTLTDSFPGKKVFECNKCMKSRDRTIPVCPWCECPEYALRVVQADGKLGRDEEFLAEMKAPPKRKAGRVPGPNWEDPDGAIDAVLGRLEAAAPDTAPIENPLTFELVVEDGTPHPSGITFEAASVEDAGRVAAEKWPGWFFRIRGLYDDVLTPPAAREPELRPGPNREWAVIRHYPEGRRLSRRIGTVTAPSFDLALQKVEERYGGMGRLLEVLHAAAPGASRYPVEEDDPAPDTAPMAEPQGPGRFPAVKPTKSRTGRKATYRLILEHPDHDDPVTLGEVRATSFDEAKDMLSSAYRKQIVRLDDGRMLGIDPDDVKLVLVPTPRKRREPPAVAATAGDG